MSDPKDSDNTPIVTDAGGHSWNFHQPALDAARHLIAHIIESIYERTDLNGEQKAAMISHLSGMNHEDMAKVVDSHYTNVSS